MDYITSLPKTVICVATKQAKYIDNSAYLRFRTDETEINRGRFLDKAPKHPQLQNSEKKV